MRKTAREAAELCVVTGLRCFGLCSKINNLKNNILVFFQVTPKYNYTWLEGKEQLGKATAEGINDKT